MGFNYILLFFVGKKIIKKSSELVLWLHKIQIISATNFLSFLNFKLERTYWMPGIENKNVTFALTLAGYEKYDEW
jgi:hypothetical protein